MGRSLNAGQEAGVTPAQGRQPSLVSSLAVAGEVATLASTPHLETPRHLPMLGSTIHTSRCHHVPMLSSLWISVTMPDATPRPLARAVVTSTSR